MGLRSKRCSHTYWHGVDETDFCPFRNGAGAACPWPGTLGKGVGEHWRGLQGWLPTLGLRSDRCLQAHISAWRRRDRFLSLQKRCGGCMPVAVHPRQGRRIAMAWSDRLAADLWLSGQTDPCTHLGLASMRPISTIEILDQLSVSPRSLPIGIRRSVSAVWPKLIVSQSLRLSEFLGSGNQEADWRMAMAIT